MYLLKFHYYIYIFSNSKIVIWVAIFCIIIQPSNCFIKVNRYSSSHTCMASCSGWKGPTEPNLSSSKSCNYKVRQDGLKTRNDWREPSWSASCEAWWSKAQATHNAPLQAHWGQTVSLSGTHGNPSQGRSRGSSLIRKQQCLSSDEIKHEPPY